MDVIPQIHDDIVSRLQTDLGNAGLKVERSEHEDEIVLIEWAADNLEQIARYPHAMVWVGSTNIRNEDSTRKMPGLTLPVRVFIITRDSTQENEEAQKRLSDKWALFVAASLSGARFGHDTYTNDGIVQRVRIEPIGNGEDAAISEVLFDLDLNIDFELILNNV